MLALGCVHGCWCHVHVDIATGVAPRSGTNTCPQAFARFMHVACSSSERAGLKESQREKQAARSVQYEGTTSLSVGGKSRARNQICLVKGTMQGAKGSEQV